MLRLHPAPLCAPAPPRHSALAATTRLPANKKPASPGRNVSSGLLLVLNLIHDLAHRLIELPHFFRAGRLARRKRYQLLDSGELLAHIPDQWFAAQLRRDFVDLRTH